MNNSVLNGLGSAAGYNPPPTASDTAAAVSAQPERMKVPNPGNLGKAAQDPNTHGPLAVLKAVATGQLPGVLVPHDAPKIKSSLTPQDITDVGVQMYKPVTKGLAVVIFNPKLVPASTLQVLDKKGKLGSAFPSITTLLGKADGKSGAAGSSDDSTAEPTPSPGPADPANPVGSTPAGNVNSTINDLNLTGSPAPQTPQRVPVLPHTTFSADTQKRIGNLRAKNMNAANGSILAGLTQQPL